MTDQLRLHLGCGERHLDGFVNVDIREAPAVDLVADVRFLDGFDDGSVQLIYASHVLEHFSRHEYMRVLRRWYTLLCDGGVLRLSVPDFGSVVGYYEEHRDLPMLIGLLYGGQTYEHNYHRMAWDLSSLTVDLKLVGFDKVCRYDWRLTDHCDVDDYSQSYLPHMDKEEGMLMSLNVEAIK